MKLEDLAARIRRLDRAIFSVVACKGQEPTEKDVAKFEQSVGGVGFRLPEDFRELTLSPLGGLYTEVREEHWPRAERLAVGPFWSFLYALKVFGISRDIPEWLDIREQYAEFKEFSADLVPFMAVQGNADRYCFDREGRILLWDHETGETEIVKKDLYALVIHELDELAERQKEKTKVLAKAKPAKAKPAKAKPAKAKQKGAGTKKATSKKKAQPTPVPKTLRERKAQSVKTKRAKAKKTTKAKAKAKAKKTNAAKPRKKAPATRR